VSLRDNEFGSARRLIAWEFSDILETDSDGIQHGPVPFGPAGLLTAQVPCSMGAQVAIEMHMRWGTGARPGGGLQKLLLSPQWTSFYGIDDPDSNTADKDRSVPVLFPDRNERIGRLSNAFSTATPVRPQVYRPRALTATAPVSARTVGLELCPYRFEIWRDLDPAAIYLQAVSWEFPVWGQEPQTISSGTTSALRQMPRERPLRFVLDWQGTAANDPANPPFIANDSIEMFVRVGSTGS
jgi:hypothetical protein